MGDDKTALDSIYSLFPITREIGPQARTFDCAVQGKIAIPVLNQIVRPLHREVAQGEPGRGL